MFANNFRYLKGLLFGRIKRSKFGKKVRFGSNIEIINSTIGNYCGLADYCSVRDSKIGDYSSVGRFSKINNCEIGKFCSIGWDTTVGANNHDYTRLTTNAFPYAKRVIGYEMKAPEKLKTILGNDVWIGANAVILPGIKIGDGAVIGAGSVVTKNVPEYEIWAGNPAKKIKNRFSKEVVCKLKTLQYWTWNDEKLKKNIQLFTLPINEKNIDEVIKSIR